MSHRLAVLLNVNAKSATKSIRQKLAKLIPSQDLYISNDLEESFKHIETIFNKSYTYLFVGGGDGTFVNAVNNMRMLNKQHPHAKIPIFGVLKLGTGNALARKFNAKNPIEDIKYILSGKKLLTNTLSMIENEEGLLAPFAGMGYDGEITRDFQKYKKIFFNSPLRKLFASPAGYAVAGLFRTLPQQFKKKIPYIKVYAKGTAYAIIKNKGVDEEHCLERNAKIFEGPASIICAGTIESVGYNFKMFPFVDRRPGFMQLRVSNVPLGKILLNLFSSVWPGKFRDKKLLDFLVKDVQIECDIPMPFQFGGDPKGTKKNINFMVAKEPVKIAYIPKVKGYGEISSTPVMTPIS